jgi:hypothetical protein
MLYYNLIASEDLVPTISKISDNKIIINQARLISKKLGLRCIGHLVNEFKFPSNDELQCIVKNVIVACPILKVLASRKVLTYGLSLKDHFPISTNHFITSDKITTKALKKCYLEGGNAPNILTHFNFIKTICHPKEREIMFLYLHDALLPNKKLFEMKLIASPNCNLCNVEQTAEHILNDCINIVSGIDTLNLITDKLQISKSLYMNCLALVKRFCYINKDKKLSTDLFRSAIENRLNDFNRISRKKMLKKELDTINNVSLM